MRLHATPALLALAALVAAGGLAGCSNPCQELGNKLCACRASSTDRTTCERAVKDELNRLHPGKDVENLCDEKVKTCEAPKGVDFCTWLDGEDGKVACGLAYPPDVPPAP
jgi:hypothetical protein